MILATCGVTNVDAPAPLKVAQDKTYSHFRQSKFVPYSTSPHIPRTAFRKVVASQPLHCA